MHKIKKGGLIASIFILIILISACQRTQISGKEIKEEKIPAMNVISYDKDEVEVVIDDLAFLPAFIHIKPGTAVTWINKDNAEHTVAFNNRKIPSGITESDVIKEGGSYIQIFNEEGIYDYICGIHPFMKGGIIVGNPAEMNLMMEFADDTLAPKVFSISPDKGSVNGDEKIIIKGENFVSGTTVFFHHLFGKVTVLDSNTLEVITPEHYAAKIDVIITNPDGDHFTFLESFEFAEMGSKETEPAQFMYDEKKTPHFTGSVPEHGSSVSSLKSISISFNYPIVKGSTIILYDLEGNKIAEGAVTLTKLGLEISSVPALSKGIYKAAYHAIWLGGSYHDGEFYFNVV